MQELRDAGYLPEAVRNYLALLGWGSADDETLISTEDLVEQFDIARVSKNPAQFDEQKLRWMNGRYLRELDDAELTARARARSRAARAWRAAVAISREKIQTLADFWPLAGFIFDGPADDPEGAREVARRRAPRRCSARRARRSPASSRSMLEPLEAALRGVVESRGVKPKDVFQPVRVALAGTTVSPGIFETLAVLGRDESLRRIDDSLSVRS